MESRNSLNKTDDAASYQQPETPRLCARGCGFFGHPATRNLCSKCYRDFMKEEKDKQAKALVFEKFSAINYTTPDLAIPKTNPFPCFNARHASKTSAVSATGTAGEENIANSTTKKKRCHCCNKKIGLFGFACRCGELFCSIHRYPEAHACKFDFKSTGRAALAKENPLCKADKMQNRI